MISICHLHSAPAIHSQTLKYCHTELEKENEKEHEEVKRTVTPTTTKHDKFSTAILVFIVYKSIPIMFYTHMKSI